MMGVQRVCDVSGVCGDLALSWLRGPATPLDASDAAYVSAVCRAFVEPTSAGAAFGPVDIRLAADWQASAAPPESARSPLAGLFVQVVGATRAARLTADPQPALLQGAAARS